MKTALYAACSGLALVLASPALAQQTQEPASEGSGQTAGNAQDISTDQNILVTASRRDERLQDVPSAITSLEGAKLEQIGAQSFAEYSTLVPGLSQRDFGNPGTGTIIIRGLNTGPQQTTNTAATYIDDTPFSASGFLSVGAVLTPDPDIADIERIEVLKGPQGTLFGANTLGGIIRIISTRPDLDEFSGRVWAEGTTVDHGGTGYSLRGAVNVPIVTDQLAVRANGVYRRYPGFMDNVTTGDENANVSTLWGARLGVRYQPTSDLTIDLNGLWQEIENRGGNAQDLVTGTRTPLDCRYCYRSVPLDPSELKYNIASAVVDYDFGPVSLIATGSYGRYRSLITADYTPIYLPYLRAISPVLAFLLPADGQVTGEIGPNMDKWTAEVRLVSERIGPVEFVAGAFYTNEDNAYVTELTARNASGAPLTAPFDRLLSATTDSNYEEIAGFGNLTFYISDRVDVTGGIRIAHNENVSSSDGGINFYAPTPASSFSSSDTVATYLATLRIRPTDDVSLYARAASGYRPGGPQTSVNVPPGLPDTILPDTVWNYEVGFRGQFLDGALALSGSVFHIDWTNIQLNSLSGGLLLLTNGGDAKVDGVELEAVMRPTHLLTISANFGYTNARISEVDPDVAVVIGAASGDKLPLTPEFTAAVIADHRIPLSPAVDGNVGATLRFRSDMPSSFPGSILNPNQNVPGWATVDLRAGVDFDRFHVQARIDNLFDKFAYTGLSTNLVTPLIPVPTVGTIIRPRAFTLAVSVDF